MKKILFLFIALLSCSVFAQQPTLFVQQAKSALFTPENNGCFTLTLITPKNKVLYFASAPNTEIGHASTKELFRAWKEHVKPLNAALVGTNNSGKELTYAFKISKPQLNTTTKRITYKVCALENKTLKPIITQVLNNTSVFIDPIKHWPP
jgi:hypothetical protein